MQTEQEAAGCAERNQGTCGHVRITSGKIMLYEGWTAWGSQPCRKIEGTRVVRHAKERADGIASPVCFALAVTLGYAWHIENAPCSSLK